MRPKILFIGSFKNKGKNGNVGGQMFACNSLIRSELNEEIEWILLDTTANTNLQRTFISRLFKGIRRLLKAIYILLFKDIDVAMAFCSSGYSFIEKSTILRIGRFLKKKTIIFPRSGHIIDQIETDPKFKKIVDQTFQACDKVICQGTFWKKFFIDHFDHPESKYTIIHNWIKIENYTNEKTHVNSPIKILFLGWIERNKGIWDILDVFTLLRKQNFILEIAGNGKDFEAFKFAVNEAGLDNKINFLNWVYGDQKIKLLSEADILLLPSYREGLPNSLLEAMASNTAIITTNVGAISDIINNGKNGFLIEPGDQEAMMKCLISYFEDPALIKKHSELALATVRKYNNLESVIPKFRKLFDELIES